MNNHKIKLPTSTELAGLNACHEAIEWFDAQPDALTAMKNCKRPSWMIWYLRASGQMTTKLDRQIQLMALETPLADGRQVIDLITDERSLAFIDLKKRWLADENISAADAAAAYADATDATDAYYADATTAYSAATAATDADTADASAAADAADAADSAYAYAYSAYSAYSAATAAAATTAATTAAAADATAAASAASAASADTADASAAADAAATDAKEFQANGIRNLIEVSI